MLPVSAWPPGAPGASLSPFGQPRVISLDRHPRGFVIPKGAWVVRTTSNRVVMFMPPVELHNPPRTPGTGFLPGQIPPPPHPPLPPCPTPAPAAARTASPVIASATRRGVDCGPPPQQKQFIRFDDYLEAWRAWQRRIGRTDPPNRPLPGRRPPNWFGWRFDRCAPRMTVVRQNSAGTVLADGQNVVIAGCGPATLVQAFSV